MKKAFVIGDSKCANFLSNISIVDNIEDAEVVIFTGGEDVTPSFYKEKKLAPTKNNYQRDLKERAIYRKLRSDQFLIGLGRGCQFLAVMNGAKLQQHVLLNNNASHEIIFEDGLFLNILSNNHQIVINKTLPEHCHTIANTLRLLNGVPVFIPEVFFFNNKETPKCFCIQGHPELTPDEPIAKHLDNIIQQLW